MISKRRSDSSPLVESVGKKTLRNLGVLCGSAVSSFLAEFHRRVAEDAEVAQRKHVFPTDSSSGFAESLRSRRKHKAWGVSPRKVREPNEIYKHLAALRP